MYTGIVYHCLPYFVADTFMHRTFTLCINFIEAALKKCWLHLQCHRKTIERPQRGRLQPYRNPENALHVSSDNGRSTSLFSKSTRRIIVMTRVTATSIMRCLATMTPTSRSMAVITKGGNVRLTSIAGHTIA